MMRTLSLVIVLVLSSCARRSPEAEVSNATTTTVPVVPTAIPNPSETPAATPVPLPCPKAVVVPPRALASGWPALVGQRVRLRVVPVRAMDFTTWLVVADGQRLVVLAPPDTTWVGAHVFVVMGSASIALHGRIILPELVLDDDCRA